MTKPPALDSVCVYCGSSNAADPALLKAAADFGALLAKSGVRMVYGGGQVGLMGACARAAHSGGGRVLGVIPKFLMRREVVYEDVETRVVDTMHQRKLLMFEEADAFVVLPGGVGTLEEVIELMSWRRLSLHTKPIVFLNQDGYWEPFFALIRHTVDHHLTPVEFLDCWRSVERIEDILPAIESMAGQAGVTVVPLVT
ncbi:MAG: TIGR00730 family Rossman fold protein [Alphaproteobacteria bacterium]